MSTVKISDTIRTSASELAIETNTTRSSTAVTEYSPTVPASMQTEPELTATKTSRSFTSDTSVIRHTGDSGILTEKATATAVSNARAGTSIHVTWTKPSDTQRTTAIKLKASTHTNAVSPVVSVTVPSQKIATTSVPSVTNVTEDLSCIAAKCQNNGTCISGRPEPARCLCIDGFTGKHCEQIVNVCASSPCGNGSCSQHGATDFTCVCPLGFTGEKCANDIDECAFSPCFHGATCENNIGGYKCRCRPGYSDHVCSTNIDECLSAPCQNSGFCVPLVNNFRCICKNGFAGRICELDVDECASNPCHSNATCRNGVGHYSCECISGFTGVNCDFNINDCEPNQCENGGLCRDMVNAFACVCPTGFTGDTCAVNVDDCAGIVCQHNGSCADQTNTFKCLCQQGYEGEFCQILQNECESNPCMNGGNCTDELARFECSCPPQFTGVRCQTDICDPNPCEHDGNCSYVTKSGENWFSCDCESGYLGERCDVADDRCKSNPCRNGGTCTDSGLRFFCNCPQFFDGPLCEAEIDECESNPCLHYGTCNDFLGVFNCSCYPAFTGPRCEVSLTTCTQQSDDKRGRRITMMATQSLTSTTTLIVLSVLLVLFLFIADFSVARILHMGEEVTLLLAHLVILLARSPTLFDLGAFCDATASGSPTKLDENECRLIGMLLHYLFFSHFLLLMLEAAHNYTIYTNVVSERPILFRVQIIVLALLAPLLPVALACLIDYKGYTTELTCWLNFDKINLYIELIPHAVLATMAMVMSEAVGMIAYPVNPFSSVDLRKSAYVNSRFSLVIVPLSFAAWLIGALAVDRTDLSLYSMACTLNIVLVVCVAVAHTVGSQRARTIFCTVCCFCVRKENQSTVSSAAQ